jgi:phosphoglycolate phosphatase-like HAD superfamily hydrolase
MFGSKARDNARVLLLFDIDGTLLLEAGRPHREALLGALRDVYALENPARHRVSAAGRTDSQIARDIALAGGLPSERFDALLPELQRACVEAFERHCPPRLTPAPGVPELLRALASDPELRLSLLTGNYELVARAKLERAGIGHYFPAGQGAFGSDAEQRELLGPIARARAGAPGPPYPREQTTIIGDTPLDIACARADGLGVIAVATGPYAADALSAADAVADDAYALRDLLLGRAGVR